jgi:hypothetical protein
LTNRAEAPIALGINVLPSGNAFPVIAQTRRTLLEELGNSIGIPGYQG